jgi:hypothetical protein
MCGTQEIIPMITVSVREANAMKEAGLWNDFTMKVSPDMSGHAPAQGDNRWPRMGGKPSKGTRRDKRLKKNK